MHLQPQTCFMTDLSSYFLTDLVLFHHIIFPNQSNHIRVFEEYGLILNKILGLVPSFALQSYYTRGALCEETSLFADSK